MGCVSDAVDAYIRRSKTDTNQRIVQMLFPDGTEQDHWYYVSDQAIYTSRFPVGRDDLVIEEYEGPADGIGAELKPYFQLNEIAETETEIARKAIECGANSFYQYVAFRTSQLLSHSTGHLQVRKKL